MDIVDDGMFMERRLGWRYGGESAHRKDEKWQNVAGSGVVQQAQQGEEGGGLLVRQSFLTTSTDLRVRISVEHLHAAHLAHIIIRRQHHPHPARDAGGRS